LVGETKGRDRDGFKFSRDGSIMLDGLEMLNIWGEAGSGKIVHAFIKAGMKGNFDSFGFGVIPEYVLGSIAKKSEKDTFASMLLEFARAKARRSNPDTTTKCCKNLACG
jgi:hypothetical protein